MFRFIDDVNQQPMLPYHYAQHFLFKGLLPEMNHAPYPSSAKNLSNSYNITYDVNSAEPLSTTLLSIRQTAVDIQACRRDFHFLVETIANILKIFESHVNINGLQLNDCPKKPRDHTINKHYNDKLFSFNDTNEKADLINGLREKLKDLQLEFVGQDTSWFNYNLEWEYDKDINWYEKARKKYQNPDFQIHWENHNISNGSSISLCESETFSLLPESPNALVRVVSCMKSHFKARLYSLSGYINLRRHNRYLRHQSVTRLDDLLTDSNSVMSRLINSAALLFVSKDNRPWFREQLLGCYAQFKSALVIFMPVLGLFLVVLIVWACSTYLA